jgi:tetratricopeptide (TPR) repeat protein
MSPEQARGGILAAATDIFSMGIVWYELATGIHPFHADSPYGVVNAIVSQRPITPTRVNPEIPGWFESLILRMLEKTPELRPSAAEVTEALGAERASVRLPVAGPLRERQTVGREKERVMLRAAFDRAATRCGQVACVAGEPGIGKSTFVEDFLSDLRASGASVRVGRGKSSESLAGTEAYLPFLEALGGLLASGDSNLTQTMKFLAPSWFAELVPSTTGSADRPKGETGPGSLGHFKREIASFIQEICVEKPLVLFFDDIHWADDSTIDVLAFLASKIDSSALLFIVAYRPEDLLLRNHSFLRIRRELQARGIAREIPLEFLGVDDVRQYLAIEFPRHRFPRGFPELIHAKTEGNPLFMVDVLRFLKDQRIIAKENEHWSLVQSVPDIEKVLPETVRGMIQRKVDLVDEADRKLLMAAAVQGATFEASIVAAALNQEAAEVEEQLDKCERVYALVRRLHEWEFPNGALSLRYQFVHVLYRNVLYATLTPARKALLSAAVARALEEFYKDKTADVSSTLAVLWEAARDFDRAIRHSLVASKGATRVFAHREAVILGRRGLDLLSLLPKSSERDRLELELLLAVGVPLIISEGFASSQVQDVYTRASQLCGELGESDRLIRVLRGLWTVQMVRLNIHGATPIAEQLEVLGTSDSKRFGVLAHIVAGLTALYRGTYSAAAMNLQQALRSWSPDDEQRYIHLFPYDHAMECEAGLARILWAQGYPDQGLEFSHAAVARSRRLKSFHSLVYALYFSAVLYHYREELDPFDAVVTEMVELSREHRHAHFSAIAHFLGGWSALQRGDTEGGLQRMVEGLDLYRAVEAASSLPHFLSLMADVYGKLSDPLRGLLLIDEAFAIVESGGAHFYDAELWRVKGRLIGRAQKDEQGWTEAKRCLDKALSVARTQETKGFELRAAMDLVEHCMGTDSLALARQRLHEVFHSFREGFDTADLRRAKALLLDERLSGLPSA